MNYVSGHRYCNRASRLKWGSESDSDTRGGQCSFAGFSLLVKDDIYERLLTFEKVMIELAEV